MPEYRSGGGSKIAQEQENPVSVALNEDFEGKKRRKRRFWNIVNSGLAGGLVIFGALLSGELTFKVVIAAIIAGGLAAVVQFKHFWDSEKKEYYKGAFSWL